MKNRVSKFFKEIGSEIKMGMCGSSIQGVDESDGLKIDGWFMGRKIGKGASGKVFLAKNAKTGKVFRRPKYFFFSTLTRTNTQVN